MREGACWCRCPSTLAGIAYLVAGVFNQLLDAFASYLGADIGWGQLVDRGPLSVLLTRSDLMHALWAEAGDTA